MAIKYRLFKVARELNTGSSTLVDHLRDKGFDLDNNPNAKLTEDMYNVLLKEFAQEKALKQKAEQIKEKKREEKLAGSEEAPSEDQAHLSAADLKSGILNPAAKPKTAPRPMARPRVKPEEAPKADPPAVKPPVAQPPVEPVKEEKPVVEAKTETPPPAEEDNKTPGLKVLDKIDLSQFDRKKKKSSKPAPAKSETPKAKPAAEKPKPVAEKPPVEKPVEKKAPAAEEKPATKKPSAEKPAVENPAKEAKPKAEKPVAEAKAADQAGEKAEPAAEKDEIVRAADHTPKLAGLKVLGKVELPSDRSKSKTKKDDGDSDGDKKKRRRKRKRKTTGGTSVSNPSQSNNSRGRGGKSNSNDRRTKEEPTDKEIQDQIKKTLAEIESRASRDRQRMRREKRQQGARRREREAIEKEAESQVLEVTEFITANELANMMEVPVTALITKCMEIGMFVSINQRLEADVIELLTEEFGYHVHFVDITEKDFEDVEEEDNPEDLKPRPPIVTVMGHVDHGKTSLLDHIRKANVIAGEAGGITQHIGAYEVTLPNGQNICFLDTPGHEAFTAMRARGAKVTDLVIIVIAADDNVMPQTKEAINHAQAAGVPMIFALNKIDKDGADTDRIRSELSEMNILLEDWGGKYQSQEISAKNGVGIEELLEKVLLEAEMLEVKAVPNKLARGTIIEARLDRGRGVVATLLVQEGTLKIQDDMVAGIHFGRVRAMMDERGKRIKSAGPSTPVQLLGMTGVPQAGDRFVVYDTEKRAKEIANKRNELYREQAMRQTKRLSLEEVARRSKIGEVKDLNIIVKGDVDGSVEALADSLLRLSIEEVNVNVVRKAVGQITEADVLLASASDAVIIGFQVRPSVGARKLAEKEGIDIRLYSIIYNAINEVRDALEGLLSPDLQEEILGTAEIREVFRITKVGNVAGCMVTDGMFIRKEPVRLIRDGIVVYTGNLAALKRFKDDAKEVKTGFECGMQIDGYNDIKVGDVIEQFRTKEVKRTLGPKK